MQPSAPTPQNTLADINNTQQKVNQLSIFQKYKELWQSNQWVPIATGLIVLITVLIGVLITMALTDNSNNVTPPDTDNEVEAESQIPTTKDSSDDAYFAKQLDSIIYYSFAQTTNSKNIIQSTPTDTENRIIDIGFPDKYNFSISPDGKWIVRWNDTQLERSSSLKPSEFSTLASLNQSQRISSVVWQSDSSTLAFTASRQSDSDNSSTTIALVPQLTLDTVEVYTAETATTLHAVAFPEADKLFIQEMTNDKPQNLSIVNPRTGELVETYTHLNNKKWFNQIQYSHQMDFAVYATKNSIMKVDLKTGKESLVHRQSTDCQYNRQDNQSSITGLSLSPSGNNLVYLESLDYCSETIREAEKQDRDLPSNRLTVYSIKDDKNLHQRGNVDVSNISKSLWSATESYLWLSTSDDTSHIVTLRDLTINPVPNLKRQSLLKERIFPIGWLHTAK